MSNACPECAHEASLHRLQPAAHLGSRCHSIANDTLYQCTCKLSERDVLLAVSAVRAHEIQQLEQAHTATLNSAHGQIHAGREALERIDRIIGNEEMTWRERLQRIQHVARTALTAHHCLNCQALRAEGERMAASEDAILSVAGKRILTTLAAHVAPPNGAGMRSQGSASGVNSDNGTKDPAPESNAAPPSETSNVTTNEWPSEFGPPTAAEG